MLGSLWAEADGHEQAPPNPCGLIGNTNLALISFSLIAGLPGNTSQDGLVDNTNAFLFIFTSFSSWWDSNCAFPERDFKQNNSKRERPTKLRTMEAALETLLASIFNQSSRPKMVWLQGPCQRVPFPRSVALDAATLITGRLKMPSSHK